MIALDKPTLYAVIFGNSFLLALIWGLIWRSHPNLKAVKHWFSSVAITAISGLTLLSLHDNRIASYLAVALASAAFALLWAGVDTFFSRATRAYLVPLFFLITLILLVVTSGDTVVFSFVAALGQAVPASLIIVSLLRARWYAGSIAAIISSSLIVLSQVFEALTAIVTASGWLHSASHGQLTSFYLLLTIAGGTGCNLGFVLMALDRAMIRLRRQAELDPLTGLLNRRALSDRIASASYKAPAHAVAALVMLDVDGLKQINDSLGHAAGDGALIHVSTVVADELQSDDFCVRMGGDEFLLVLLKTSCEGGAAMVCSRIENMLKVTPFLWNETAISLSVSFGTSLWIMADLSSFDSKVTAADRELYIKKRMMAADGRAGRCTQAGGVNRITSSISGSVVGGSHDVLAVESLSSRVKRWVQ
jgi:diguanylate cyclase (GGDEF)-like protein